MATEDKIVHSDLLETLNYVNGKKGADTRNYTEAAENMIRKFEAKNHIHPDDITPAELSVEGRRAALATQNRDSDATSNRATNEEIANIRTLRESAFTQITDRLAHQEAPMKLSDVAKLETAASYYLDELDMLRNRKLIKEDEYNARVNGGDITVNGKREHISGVKADFRAVEAMHPEMEKYFALPEKATAGQGNVATLPENIPQIREIREKLRSNSVTHAPDASAPLASATPSIPQGQYNAR